MNPSDPPATPLPPDDFQREILARNLLRLVRCGVNSLSPILLAGAWGTGKSIFCRHVERIIRSEKGSQTRPLDCIYIDAFRADHSDDPLMMILSFLDRHAASASATMRTALRRAALPYVGILARSLGKAALELAIPGNGGTLLESVRLAAAGVYETAVTRALEECARTEERITALQTVLTRLTRRRSLLIIVDELDRCRPDFAVALLEKIKHVFTVPNITFLLVANVGQLRNSLAHQYGLQADEADRYLDKFIHYTFTLNTTCDEWRHDSSDASVIHFYDEVRAFPFPSVFDAGAELLGMPTYLNIKSHSLREVETYARYLHVLEVLSGEETIRALRVHPVLRDLAMLAVYIFCFKPAMARDLARGIYRADEVLDLLDTSEMERDDLLESILRLLAYCANGLRNDGVFYDPACRPAHAWLVEQNTSSFPLRYPEILWHRFFLGHIRTLNLHALG